MDCKPTFNFWFGVLFLKEGEGLTAKKDPVSTLQYLLGPLPKLIVSGHLLGVQLMSVNAYLHTSITYGQWEGWDGKPLAEAPLFYNGLTKSAASIISSVSDEVVNIAKGFAEKTGADMSNVRRSTLFFDLQFMLHSSGGFLPWQETKLYPRILKLWVPMKDWDNRSHDANLLRITYERS